MTENRLGPLYSTSGESTNSGGLSPCFGEPCRALARRFFSGICSLRLAFLVTAACQMALAGLVNVYPAHTSVYLDSSPKDWASGFSFFFCVFPPCLLWNSREGEGCVTPCMTTRHTGTLREAGQVRRLSEIHESLSAPLTPSS